MKGVKVPVRGPWSRRAKQSVGAVWEGNAGADVAPVLPSLLQRSPTDEEGPGEGGQREQVMAEPWARAGRVDPISSASPASLPPHPGDILGS